MFLELAYKTLHIKPVMAESTLEEPGLAFLLTHDPICVVPCLIKVKLLYRYVSQQICSSSTQDPSPL